jgi:DNA-binding MarR family transcriptional regulator
MSSMSRTIETRSLDEVAVEELAAAAWQLVRRARAEGNTDELTWSQMVVVGRLGKNGPMTTADLARAESVKPQSMGATLAALEEQGLFALTKAGTAMRETRSKRKRAWLAEALSKLDASERRALRDAVAPMKRLANS